MITAEEALKEAERFRKFVQLPEEERTGKSPMKAIVEDDREIAAVEFSDGTLVEVGKLCVFVKLLTSKVTRIVAYSEESPAGYTPWVAIYCEDEIVGRGDLSGAKIVYKQKEEGEN